MSEPFTEDNANTHVVDIDSIEEAKFENLANGWYDGVVDEHTYELSQNSGQPMWALVIQLDLPEGKTRKMRYYMSWSPAAAPYTKPTFLKVWPGISQDPQYRTSNGGLDVKKIGDESVFCGTRVRAKIGKQNYEGTKRDTIKELQPGADQNQFLSA
jgi:hypothetical protein